MTDQSYGLPTDTKLHYDTVPGAADALAVTINKKSLCVIERFAVSTELQKEAVAKAMAVISKQWMRADDFVGSALLRGRERGGIAVYSQWLHGEADPEDSTPASRLLSERLPGYRVLDSDTFTVAFTAQPPGTDAPSLILIESTPLAHFGMFRVAPAHVDELLRRAKVDAPNSFRVKGLKAINFHRSTDGAFVVNLGLWSTFEHFANLQNAPGFADKKEYFRGLAEFEPDYFDVVAVNVKARRSQTDKTSEMPN